MAKRIEKEETKKELTLNIDPQILINEYKLEKTRFESLDSRYKENDEIKYQLRQIHTLLWMLISSSIKVK